jgi:acyl-CoA dehydrogenase
MIARQGFARRAMDFTLPPRTEDFRRRIAAFVEARILPAEADRANWDAHGNIAHAPLEALRAQARAEGLWCLQLSPEHGGQGLGLMGMAVCYEAMNRSIFGPVVFNSAAPDDGNMMLLAKVGTAEQKARWLAPIAQGRVRSAFAMTEPHPGGISGSSPAPRRRSISS